MSRKERHREIINLVNNNNGCSVDELVANFDVSDATIRRDLRELAEQNLIERTHGGAVPIVDRGKPYDNRKTYNQDRKEAIGRRAVDEIFADQIVLFDSGSTAHEVSKQVPDELEFTAITPMPVIAHELGMKGHSPDLTGGAYKQGTHSCVGPWAEKYVNQMNLDLLFLCTDGIDEEGLSIRNIKQSYLKERMIDRAERTVLIADHSKFGASHAYNFADYTDLDVFVTDDSIPASIRAELEAAGVELITHTY